MEYFETSHLESVLMLSILLEMFIKNTFYHRKLGSQPFKLSVRLEKVQKAISTLIKVKINILFVLILYLGNLLLLVVLNMIFKSI